MTPRHRAEEFRRFLNQIDASVPADIDVHVVLDNSSTHKTPSIQRWLVRHPRLTFHFTPTYSSWLNLVERWPAELTTKWIKRGSHRSVCELVASIRSWITNWNDDPSPSSGTRAPTRSSTASPPRRLAASPPRRLAASPPRRLAASPPRASLPASYRRSQSNERIGRVRTVPTTQRTTGLLVPPAAAGARPRVRSQARGQHRSLDRRGRQPCAPHTRTRLARAMSRSVSQLALDVDHASLTSAAARPNGGSGC